MKVSTNRKENDKMLKLTLEINYYRNSVNDDLIEALARITNNINDNNSLDLKFINVEDVEED